MPPEVDLTPYHKTMQRREREWRQWQEQQQERGWRIAREGAHLLKTTFGAQQVWLFGSLLETRRVRRVSDIDLAVEGLDDRFYLKALGALLDLSDFPVDLVQTQYASPRMLQRIYSQGIKL